MEDAPTSCTLPSSPPTRFSVPLADTAPGWQVVPTPPPREPTPPSPDPTPPPRDPTPPPRDPTPPPRDPTPPPLKEPPVIVKSKKGKAKAQRHKKGKEKQAPGKESWVHGTKLIFFERCKAEYLAAAEKSRNGDKAAPGIFYTKMGQLFLLKYGYELGDNEDLAADEEANVVVNEKSSDNNESSAQYFQTLRTRIGDWYRRRYGALLKIEKAAFKELFTGTLDNAPAKPQHGQPLHYYSQRCFEERVKGRYEVRMASIQRRSQHSGEKVPAVLALQNKVTKEVWEEETPAFQAEIRVGWEREYQVALKAWESSLADSPTRTPEEMAASLDNAVYYLQPFVDAIQERFGMSVALLLCGPIGKRGGVTKGLVPMKWPEFDRAKFAKVETRMVEFGRECFSEAECRACVLGGGNTRDWSEPMASGSNSTGSTPIVADTSTALPATTPPPAYRPIAVTGTTDDTRRRQAAAAGTGAPGDSAGDGRAGDDDSRTTGGEEGGNSGDGGNGEGEDAGAGSINPDPVLQRRINDLWNRDDRAEWTGELGRAHAGLAWGRGWGIAWAECMSTFFNFESAHGYSEEKNVQIQTALRPQEISDWLAWGRQWERQMPLGFLGGEGEPGTWINRWWTWWVSLQPSERVEAEGKLAQPDSADWEKLAQPHGKNGMLQVMVTLLWWGDLVGDGEDACRHVEWVKAVDDVAWTLNELEKSGFIDGRKCGVKRKRARARAEAEAAPAKKVRRSACQDQTDEGRQTRAQVAKKGKGKEKETQGKKGV
ncbi:hypothetical protein B0H13DRAFT_2348671 [Mycena leptocephala]|nr:hypothetical protein B0H13DRAFT_2348671 [Mycena leptocephala]